MSRPFQVIVWGASGFTGRLVCEHIVRDYKTLNWAMAGRSRDKLESIRDELCKQYGLNSEEDMPAILIGDIEDQSSLNNIASQTKVIIAMAGPYGKYGTAVVNAAVENATHYVDITGEVPWVAELISTFHEKASKNGTRIVNCCGYDSIPSDLGALFAVNQFKINFDGAFPAKVTTAVVDGSGGISGGTIATGMYQVSLQKQKKKELKTKSDPLSPYTIIPEGSTPGKDKDLWGTLYNPALNTYLAPFVMQVCNSRIVQRSNYLLGWGGPAFSYTEGVATMGWASAKGVSFATILGAAVFSQTWTHPLLRKLLPAPGEGPSREKMLNGHFKHKVVAESADGKNVVVAEVGDPSRDPGYWGTSRMVLEAGLCLALEEDELNRDDRLMRGGVITPAAALGTRLIGRLKNAGWKFEVVDVRKP